jgi:hypothetical protein
MAVQTHREPFWQAVAIVRTPMEVTVTNKKEAMLSDWQGFFYGSSFIREIRILY